MKLILSLFTNNLLYSRAKNELTVANSCCWSAYNGPFWLRLGRRTDKRHCGDVIVFHCSQAKWYCNLQKIMVPKLNWLASSASNSNKFIANTEGLFHMGFTKLNGQLWWYINLNFYQGVGTQHSHTNKRPVLVMRHLGRPANANLEERANLVEIGQTLIDSYCALANLAKVIIIHLFADNQIWGLHHFTRLPEHWTILKAQRPVYLRLAFATFGRLKPTNYSNS